MLAAEQARQQNTHAIDSEQGADGVELGGEDLQDDEGKGKLAQGCAHIGALKGPLGRANLDELVPSKDHAPRSVQSQTVIVGCVAALCTGVSLLERVESSGSRPRTCWASVGLPEGVWCVVGVVVVVWGERRAEGDRATSFKVCPGVLS